VSDTLDQRPNVFAGPWVERHVERRTDGAWLAEKLADEASCIVVLAGETFPARYGGATGAEPVLLPPSALLIAPAERGAAVFLGEYHDRFCFALDLGEDEGRRLAVRLGEAEWMNLRTLGALLSAADAALLAYAQALLYWHRRHRYCGRCGAPTRSIHGGHQRLCTNPAGGHRQFPRLEPAVIVLVERAGRVLLGRQAHWPACRYSTIAGFVEPGESLEDAIAREVAEETDIRIGRCHYRSSQPWPFPASLMLGFHAAGLTDAISLNDRELEDARWWSRAALAEDIKAGTLLLPSPVSIAYRLIAEWFDYGRDGKLAEIVSAHDDIRRH
jgi:NAD+ diphosphatase